MSLDIIKPLLESGIVNDDTARVIKEAWESKLNEAREQIRGELRAEFAQKYEHDKDVMVEALDRMVTTQLSEEIAEFREERKSMNEDRVRAKQQMREAATKFNNFMVTKLAEEIRELRSDRIAQNESRQRLEQFVVRALAREVKEFAQDKRAVVEAKVKLVAEGREQLAQLKQRFVVESAKRINQIVTTQLKSEITQLKEDITLARENATGRKIFEAFAAEYSASHLNSKSETRKLLQKLQEKEQQLSESIKRIDEAQSIIKKKESEIRIITESTQREKVLGKLLSTLNKEKATVMKDLLESVQTPKLQAAFDKYLPAVLNNGGTQKSQQPAPVAKAVLAESATISEVTGDKAAKVEVEVEGRDNVIDLKRLAGL